MRSSSRAYTAPWPYDAVISGQPVMLAVDDKGKPEWHEGSIEYFSENVALTAEDRSYAQFPPEVEFPQAITDLINGAGVFEQDNEHRNNYHYAMFMDTGSGKPIKGPKFNLSINFTFTANQPVYSVTFNNVLYFAQGTRLYKVAADGVSTPAAVNTFAANVSGQMVVYRGTNATDMLFIPIGNSNNFFTMTTAEVFVQHASKAAICFGVIGDELWRSTIDGSNRTCISKSTDGSSVATFGADYIVGDSRAAITNIVALQDVLLIMKEDGVYNPTYTAGNVADEDLTPELHQLLVSGAGRKTTVWNNLLVFSFAGGLYSYDPLNSGRLLQFGPETLAENYSEVKGAVVSSCGLAGLNLFSVMYNSVNNASYLAKFGSWKFTDGERTFIPGWHMAQYKWTGKQIVHSSIHYTTVSGSRPRQYVWFADGTVQWMYVNKTLNPMDDPDYEFDTANTGYLYLPRLTAGFPFEYKIMKAIGIGGRNMLSGVRTLGVEYKYATDVAYTIVGNTSTDPGERIEITGSAIAQAFDIRISMTNTSSTITPVVNSIVAYLSIRTSTLKEIIARIRCEDAIRANDGVIMRYKWEEIRANIEASLTARGTISVISPSGETLTCIGIRFGHELEGRHPQTKAMQWSIPIRLVQVRSVASRGTWDRAGAYTWTQLASYSWAEVGII